jgi:hypothetical protein
VERQAVPVGAAGLVAEQVPAERGRAGCTVAAAAAEKIRRWGTIFHARLGLAIVVPSVWTRRARVAGAVTSTPARMPARCSTPMPAQLPATQRLSAREQERRWSNSPSRGFRCVVEPISAARGTPVRVGEVVGAVFRLEEETSGRMWAPGCRRTEATSSLALPERALADVFRLWMSASRELPQSIADGWAGRSRPKRCWSVGADSLTLEGCDRRYERRARGRPARAPELTG